MAAPCGLDRRLVGCRCEERLIWRRQRVVLAASGGEETRLETPTPASSSVRTRDLQLQSRAGTWTTGAEATGSGPGSIVVQVLKANRGVKLIRSENRRLRERRLAAFATTVALTTLAWYGQDLIAEISRRMSMPIGDLEGIIYFVVCFNAVSLALPKSRYTDWMK